MEGATTPTAPAHHQRLLELPALVLSTITSLVVEFGYGNELSLTCRAFSLTNLLHAPAFRVQLVRHHCDHLLTYRVVTALNEGALMPDLQPLAQHLTRLCISQPRDIRPAAQAFTVQLGWLPQLQVLTLSDQHSLQGVLQLLPGLPRLHTLQLPVAALRQQQELDALLAATQLTSLQLGHVAELHSSRSGAPCSWQRLELICTDLASAAYLPLHSLTHTLVQGSLHIAPEASCALVAAAVHNLTRATVSIRPPGHGVLSAEDVPLLAPLCRNCEYGGMRQLVEPGGLYSGHSDPKPELPALLE